MNANLDMQAITAMLALPERDGRYPPDVQRYLSELACRRKVILFSFPQKCGGTFLRTAAIYAIRGQLYRVCYAQGGREAQFYLPTFLQYYLSEDGRPMVTHVHMQARPGNCHFMEALGIRPVTMIRSITDMLVSMRDMYVNEPGMLAENVCCEVPEGFPNMPPAAQADFLIHFIAPWYVAYYASWIHYALDSKGNVLVLRYNDFHDHPVEVLQEVLDHAGYDVSIHDCALAIATVWGQKESYRYNKGVGGRGEVFFTQEQFGFLEKMLLQYPVLDSYHEELL